MKADDYLIFQGIESILQGIATPLFVSLGAALMRVALVGWLGFSHFFRTYFVGTVAGVLAHWVLTTHDLNPNVIAALDCMCALLAKDFLNMLMSGPVRNAVRERLIHEIRTFRRRGNE